MFTTPYRRRRSAFGSFMIFGLLLAVMVLIPAVAMCATLAFVHAWWPFVPTMPFKFALGISMISTVSALTLRFITGAIFDRN